MGAPTTRAHPATEPGCESAPAAGPAHAFGSASAPAPAVAPAFGPAPASFITQPTSSGLEREPSNPIFATAPGFPAAAYPTVGRPRPAFVHPEQLRPGVATGPLMSHEQISANLRRQSQLRMTAFIGWALFTTAATFTKDTTLAIPTALVWLAVTVALPLYVLRTNRVIDARMKSASAIGTNGQVISAHRAGRMKLGQQLACAVGALFTYGFVGRTLIAVLQTDPSQADRGAFESIAPFAGGLAAAIVAYRLIKAQFMTSAAR